MIGSVAVLVPAHWAAASQSPPATGGHLPAGCITSHVLLLGSYPSEVSANLQKEKLSPGQPTVLNGVDFYAGTLMGRRVVIAIAGPAPSETYATTLLGLRHFPCTSAVVFEGTAGGGGSTGLGDVAVPSAWTDNNGATFTSVSPAALAVAQQIRDEATSQLANSAAIDDGPCTCQGQAQALQVVPLLRVPQVVVGGDGTTYGGQDLSCIAGGGMLEGCNPCPPSSGASVVDVNLPVVLGTSQRAVARQLSLDVRNGRLVPDARLVLEHVAAPPPLAITRTESPATGTTTAGTNYIADDEQTTGAQQAADAEHVPFIAFRGISDTSVVGDLWPFEWLVYQQLAANNAATTAMLWIESWSPD
jgi:nucleoside phosphorylase